MLVRYIYDGGALAQGRCELCWTLSISASVSVSVSLSLCLSLSFSLAGSPSRTLFQALVHTGVAARLLAHFFSSQADCWPSCPRAPTCFLPLRSSACSKRMAVRPDQSSTPFLCSGKIKREKECSKRIHFAHLSTSNMTSNPASEFGIRIRIPVTCSGSFLPLFKCSLDCVTGSVTFLGTLAFCDFMRVVCDLTKVVCDK